jgi:hypothetical protein
MLQLPTEFLELPAKRLGPQIGQDDNGIRERPTVSKRVRKKRQLAAKLTNDQSLSKVCANQHGQPRQDHPARDRDGHIDRFIEKSMHLEGLNCRFAGYEIVTPESCTE